MLTKHEKWLRRQWDKEGGLDVKKAARKLGYRGNSITKGMWHIRKVMANMGITVR